MFRIKSKDQLTTELIYKLVELFKLNEQPHLKELKQYYLGNTKISHKQEVLNKPSNKINSPFCQYITDSITGYFLGNPVSYSSKNETYMIKLQSILDDNLEQGHNVNLAKNLSIYGKAFELLYLNEQLEPKISLLNPEETFMIMDSSLDAKPLAGVRFYSTADYVSGEESLTVEVYTDTDILIYEDEELVNSKEHFFQGVPVVFYNNTADQQGDFEQVMNLVDAYDSAVSDTMDNLDYFADAFLTISDSTLEQEDLVGLKESRIMLLNDGAKAEWLVKGADTVQAEEFKKRIKDDIFHLSAVPNMNSENLGSGASGESMKYRMVALDNKIVGKERLFAKSLEVRLKLLTNIINLKGGSYSVDDIMFKFHKNLPVNMNYVADLAQKLAGVVSHETLLSQLPFVSDPKQELDLINKEKGLDVSPYLGGL